MFGPKPKSYWSKNCRHPWLQFEVGNHYKVIKEFTDFDQDIHLVGEEWIYVGYNFSPHEEGFSLFIQNDMGEWHIRMQDSKKEQRDIIEDMSRYIEKSNIGSA